MTTIEYPFTWSVPLGDGWLVCADIEVKAQITGDAASPGDWRLAGLTLLAAKPVVDDGRTIGHTLADCPMPNTHYLYPRIAADLLADRESREEIAGLWAAHVADQSPTPPRSLHRSAAA